MFELKENKSVVFGNRNEFVGVWFIYGGSNLDNGTSMVVVDVDF